MSNENPSGQLGQPQQTPPQPQYGAPPQPPPQSQYGAPLPTTQQPQYGAPQQPQYGAPQPTTQQPQYGASPQPQYGAAQPPPQYGPAPGVPVAHPPAGAPGLPPQGGYPNPPGPSGLPTKGSNTRIIGIVVALVAVFALVGGVIMFVSSKSTTTPRNQPVISQPTDPSTDPATPSTGSAGTTVPVALGITATLPNASWKVQTTVTGGIVILNASARVYVQIQAQSAQKTTALTLCGLVLDNAAKGLANLTKNPCLPERDFGAVKTATGEVGGTFTSSTGSVELATIVLAGVRADGLVTGTQVLYPLKSPPTAATLKEASSIFASVMASQNAAP